MAASRNRRRPGKTSTETRRASSEPLLESADAHHRRGELGAAAELYDRFLATSPRRSDVLHVRGMLALQTGDPGTARGFLERAVREEPGQVAYRVNLAAAMRACGDVEAAVELLARVLDDAPTDPAVHVSLARALIDAGDSQRAAVHARRALGLDRQSFSSLFHAGVILRRAGHGAEAASTLRDALAVAERRPPPAAALATAANELGLALESAEDFPAATEAFRRATVLDPSFAGAFSNLGRMLHRAGEYASAVEMYQRALTTGGDRSAIESNLGNTLREMGDLPGAADCYRRAIAAHPSFPAAYNNLGNVLRDQGLLDEAAKAYEAAIALDPAFATAHANLGALRQRQDALEDAVRSFERARELDPGLRNAYVGLSWLLPATGRIEALRELFVEWARHLPNDPIASHMLAASGVGAEHPSRASAEYVSSYFDDFATTFDSTLERLGYEGPQRVARALETALEGHKTSAILDAGCGTGLCGPLIRACTATLVGVDLSAKMLERAREREVYDELENVDLLEYLRGRSSAFDAIVAADVLIYFGELNDLLRGLFDAARDDAVLVFTIEANPDARAYRLTTSGRYAHGEAYVRDVLSACGWEVSTMMPVVLRKELEQPVSSYVVTARKRPHG